MENEVPQKHLKTGKRMIAIGLVGFVLLYLASMFLRSFTGDLPWVPTVLVIMGTVSFGFLALSLAGFGLRQYLKYKLPKVGQDKDS